LEILESDFPTPKPVSSCPEEGFGIHFSLSHLCRADPIVYPRLELSLLIDGGPRRFLVLKGAVEGGGAVGREDMLGIAVVKKKGELETRLGDKVQTPVLPKRMGPGIVRHCCNLSTQEVLVGGSRVPDHPGIHGETICERESWQRGGMERRKKISERNPVLTESKVLFEGEDKEKRRTSLQRGGTQ
jgi:hypothetical protein